MAQTLVSAFLWPYSIGRPYDQVHRLKGGINCHFCDNYLNYRILIFHIFNWQEWYKHEAGNTSHPVYQMDNLTGGIRCVFHFLLHPFISLWSKAMKMKRSKNVCSWLQLKRCISLMSLKRSSQNWVLKKDIKTYCQFTKHQPSKPYYFLRLWNCFLSWCKVRASWIL